MGRRRRADPIQFRYFQLFTFGSDEELLSAFGSLEAARRAWIAVRDEFLERWDLWGRPQAWWRFEPGVPDELRTGPHAILTDADAETWEHIEMGRRRYLVSLGIDPAPERRFVPFGSA